MTPNAEQTIPESPRQLVIRGKTYLVRELNVEDMFTVVDIVVKACGSPEQFGRMVQDIFTAFNTPEDKKKDEKKDDKASPFTSRITTIGGTVVFSLLRNLMQNARPEMQVWLSSLIDVQPDEFVKLPPATVFGMLRVLQANGDLSSFFSESAALYGTVSPSLPSGEDGETLSQSVGSGGANTETQLASGSEVSPIETTQGGPAA